VADLSQRRKQFQIAATVLGAVSVLSAAYLLVPLGIDSHSRSAELLEKQRAASALEKQVHPLRSMPELITKSQSDIEKFYRDRLQSRESTVQAEIGKLAAASHVSLSGAKYEEFPTYVPDLQVMQIEANVSGEYADIAEFINSVERSQLFFVIDGLNLGSATQDRQTGRVQLQMILETYLRPRTSEDFRQEDKKRPSANDEDEGEGD